ncbi:hypothetical protein GCM10009837_61280 [Streptomyces durmitorensis]
MLDARVPADETDDGDDRRLPQQGRRLGGVGHPQPLAAVDHDADDGGLGGGDPAHRGREQLRAERPQHGDGQHREADLTRERAHGEEDAERVRTAPPLHGEGTRGHDQRPVHDDPLRLPPLKERHDDRHDDRGAAYEDARYGRFRRAFGGQDRQVEADHADSGEDRKTPPLAPRQTAERRRGAPPEQRQEQQAGQAVAQELAARVRIVAQEAVGCEGAAYEEAGEGREQGPACEVRVHVPDARKRSGPV